MSAINDVVDKIKEILIVMMLALKYIDHKVKAMMYYRNIFKNQRGITKFAEPTQITSNRATKFKQVNNLLISQVRSEHQFFEKIVVVQS